MQRDTAQRRAIRQVIEIADRPLSPQEVLVCAQDHVPGLGIATVYRTIRGLQDEGWLAPVDIPGEAQRYEVAGKDHHHHFSCRKCGRVFEMAGCPGDLKRLLPGGFTMDGHDVVLYGYCRDCNGHR